MGTTVVTKIRGQYDGHANLDKLGILEIQSNRVDGFTNEANRKLFFSGTGTFNVSIIEDDFNFTYNGNSYHTLELTDPLHAELTFDVGEYNIEINNRYGISELNTTQGNRSVLTFKSINDVGYNSNLSVYVNRNQVGTVGGNLDSIKTINLNVIDIGTINYANPGTGTSNISGNLGALMRNNPNMVEVRIPTTNTGEITLDLGKIVNNTELTHLWIPSSELVTGDIASLGGLTKLSNTNIMFYKTRIYGEIEAFVDGQCNAATPRTECDALFLNGATFVCTFGGAYLNRYFTNVGWENVNKIFILEGSSTPSACTTVYCKGYTQAEAEAKWAGKTIIRVDA